MNGLRCALGQDERQVTLQGQGSALFIATAGVLVVAGSSRDAPIRGYTISFRGGEGFGPGADQWRNVQPTASTSIRVSVQLVGADVPVPAEPPVTAPPPLIDGMMRKIFDDLERKFAKGIPTLPPPPEPGEPVPLGRCSHCLQVARNGAHLATIGTPWAAHARVSLNAPDAGPPTCVLDLTGGDGSKLFTWGSYPLADGDTIDMGLVADAVPDPPRPVRIDPHESRRLAVAMYEGLRRVFRPTKEAR